MRMDMKTGMLCLVLVMATTVLAQTTVTTSGGTANSVPVFTGSATLGNSVITQYNGNIGLGTTTPSYALHLWSGKELRLNGGTSPTDTANYFSFGGNGTFGIDAPGVANGRFVVLNNGNVGVGTANPTSKLQVFGYKNYYVNYPIIADTSIYGDPSNFVLLLHPAYTSGNPITEHYVMGRITAIRGGIGGWNRKVSCEVNTASTYTSNRGTALCSMENWSLVTLTYNGQSYIALQPPVASSLYSIEFTGYFYVQSGQLGLTAIASSAVSNITPFSGDTITVNGGFQVNGNVTVSGGGAHITFADGTVQSTAYTGVTCGGDYAESVDVTGDRRHYGPGDVLVIDPDNPGKFLKSAGRYSTSVAGIYSTKPGVVGRRQTTPKSPDEVPMAMIGIVPTKVSAENGPVRPGDLLVTSSTPGYAMKGTDRGQLTGAVVGKALASLDAGTGVIEVLVTLQ